MEDATLYSPEGLRLYLTAAERLAFYEAAKDAERLTRTFCHTLHISGCRISEALEMPVERVDLEAKALTFRTLKKRRSGVYRVVPVPDSYIDSLDMVHGVREAQRQGKTSLRLWSWHRATAWRKVKAVMIEAGIDTALPHATAKGLRHAFGIHAIDSGVPVTELQQLLGHADIRTTQMYLNAQGEEKRSLSARMWS